MTAVLNFMFTIWLFLDPALGIDRLSSGKEGCVSSFEVDVDGPGETIDIFVALLLLLYAAAVTGGIDLFVM